MMMKEKKPYRSRKEKDLSRRDPDPGQLFAKALLERAALLSITGRTDEAVSDIVTATDKAETLRNEVLLAECRHNMSGIYYYAGRFDDAIRASTAAAEHYARSGDGINAAECMIDTGVFCKSKGDFEKALEYYAEALELMEQLENRIGIANIYNSMGQLYHMINEEDKASKCYRSAFEIFKKITDPFVMGPYYSHMGRFYKQEKDYAKSFGYYKKSLDFYKRTGNVQEQGFTCNNIALLLKTWNKTGEAMKYYRSALRHFKASDNIHGQSMVFYNIAMIFGEKNEHNRALNFFKKARNICFATHNKKSLAMILLNTGFIYLKTGDYSRAEKNLKDALALSEEMNDTNWSIMSLQELSELLMKRNDLKSAKEHCDRLKELCAAAGKRAEMAAANWTLGRITAETGEYREAETCFNECIKEFKALGKKTPQMRAVISYAEMKILKCLKTGSLPSKEVERLLEEAANELREPIEHSDGKTRIHMRAEAMSVLAFHRYAAKKILGLGTDGAVCRSFAEALSMAEKAGDLYLKAKILMRYAEHLKQENKALLAGKILKESEEITHRLSFRRSGKSPCPVFRTEKEKMRCNTE